MRFFSQNDPKWSNVKIGKSKYTLGQKGCTLNCISSASSWFDEETTPDVLAKNLSFTPDGRVEWFSIGKFFKNFEFEWRGYTFDWRSYSLDRQRIDKALKDQNKVVLLNVANGSHWVFLAGRYIPIVGYRVSDPYFYPAKMKYRKDIVGFCILKKK